MQFLYADGDGAHFMNTETYEQIALPGEALKDALKWIKAGDEVDVLFLDDEPSDIQLPGSVDLEVTETEPGLRGDTASGGGTKPATLETGVVVQVPLFISEGETIRVDTREGQVPVTGLAGELVYGKHSVRAVFLRRPGDVRRLILGGKPAYHEETGGRGAPGRRRARVRGLAGVPPPDRPDRR